MPKPARPTGTDFPRLPDGEPIHVYVKGRPQIRKSNFADEKTGEYRDVVEIVFESVAPDYMGARIWAFPGFTINGSKSVLRKIFLACIHPPKSVAAKEFQTWAPSDEDLYAVADTDKLENKQLLIIGEYPDGGGDYLKPKMFKRLARSRWVDLSEIDTVGVSAKTDEPQAENVAAVEDDSEPIDF